MQRSFMIDYHTHTALCKHAVGEMEEYVESAIDKGLTEIGISCHNPMPEGYDPEHRMSIEEFYAIYKPRVAQLREKYEGAITIKFGLEADFYPGTEAYVKDFIAQSDFDYVLGSVHYLGAWPGTDLIPVPMFERVVVNARYEEYFRRVKQLAESGLCDIIAHFDLVKKNGARPDNNTGEIDAAIREALQAIRDNHLCMEINTSGLRKKVAEIYPSENILQLAQEYSIPLTTGSDAHKPKDVGADFDTAYSFINKYANGKVCTFTQRQREEIEVTALSSVNNNGS